MVRHLVAGFVVAAAVVTLGASPRGQTAERQGTDYPAAVEAYVAGHDAAKAVAPLAGWTPVDFHGAVRRYLAHPLPRFTAAATLHLEIALGVVMLSPDLAANHLGLGNLLVGGLRQPSRNTPSLSAADLAAFAEKWYVAAASTFLMINDPARATPFVDRGLQVAPRSADLRLMNGILDEMSALATTVDDARNASQRGRFTTARRQRLMRAKDQFARLVADEARFVRARIRLGRVLWMLDDGDAAMVELLRAQGEATKPADRYLAAMFLGAIYEGKGNTTGARIAYETALEVAPASQPATVALGYLDVLSGRPDRAKALARQLLSAPPVGDEWWRYRNGGVETEALAWLRNRVWQ